MAARMDLSDIFASILLGGIGVVICLRAVLRLLHHTHRRALMWLLRHAVYPRIFQGQHFINPSRAEVTLHALHWAATAFCNFYDIHSIPDAGRRAGTLAIIHLAPLLATSHLSFVSDLMGLSLAVSRAIHRAFGIMAAIQGAFHTAVAFGLGSEMLPGMASAVMVSVFLLSITLQTRSS